MPPTSPSPSAVLDFWFDLERPGKKHDAMVREALGALYGQAARGALDAWAKGRAEGRAGETAGDGAADGGTVGHRDAERQRLALILLVDQVPRHLFRGDPRMYATDHKAAGLTAMYMGENPEAEDWGDLTPLEIFYATHPWLHAEDEVRQARINPIYHRIAPALPGLEFMAAIADLYWETIRRFGRFPHRNAVLGRDTTEQEARFLTEEWNQRRRDARTCPAVEANPFMGKGA